MSRGVAYMLIGNRHAAVTAVSMMSLRKHWDGPVVLFVGDERAVELGKHIAYSADADLVEFEPRRQKRHVGYASKPTVPQMSRFDQTLQIDGDTLVVGALDEVWPQREGEVVLTTFADWVTTGRIMSGRIRVWRDVAPTNVEVCLSKPWPALNTGVLSYCKSSVLTSEDWAEMVGRKPQQFISDEIAMQLLLPFASDVRIESCRFNCSPLYARREDVRIYHYHGKKHTRPEALESWWPAYREAVDRNWGRIREWSPAGDKRLADHLAANGYPIPRGFNGLLEGR